MSAIHIKIKIKNATCFGHSYSTIIRGSQYTVHEQTPYGLAHRIYRHTGNTQPHARMRYCTHLVVVNAQAL
jgi:hypothetical protein